MISKIAMEEMYYQEYTYAINSQLMKQAANKIKSKHI